MKPSSQQSANLDFLRAVAVMCVFSAHLYYFLTGVPVRATLDIARLGVLMFFVHTSLVLMMSLEREELEGKQLAISFYIRRFFRIYPLSALCVVIVVLVTVAFFHLHWTLKEMLGNLLLVQNLLGVQDLNLVFWTLPIEVQMYFFLPFLFFLACSSRMRTVYLLWCASVALALIQPHVTARLNVFSYAPCFVPGVIAWMFVTRYRPRLPGYLWPIALGAISLVSSLYLNHRSVNYVSWIFCLVLGFAIPQFKELRIGWLKVVSKTIAKYSYGIYLSHAYAIAIGIRLFRSPLPRWIAVVFLAVALPYAMYHLIEEPGIRLGRHLAEKAVGPRDAIAPEPTLGPERSLPIT